MAHSTGDPPAAPTASISERERFLQRVPLFSDLDAEELRALAESPSLSGSPTTARDPEERPQRAD